MKLNQISIGIIALCLSILPLRQATAAAEVWRTAPAQFNNKEAIETRFIYVGKGETWVSPTFKAKVNVSYPTALSVRLNGRPVHSTMLTANRDLEFKLDQLKTGFNRLDFFVRQTPIMAEENEHECRVGTFGVFNIGQGEISYSRKLSELMLSNLPDTLFNPHVLDRRPYVGRARVNTKNAAELTALSRLTSAWASTSGVRWIESSLPESHRSDFTVEFKRDAQYKNEAHISIYFAEKRPQDHSHPILRINYGNEQALLSAINGLTNKNYLSQLRGNGIRVSDSINEPVWGKPKQFNTLAHLGIDSFRLDSGVRAFVLNFPGVWQPTGPLQGSVAFKSQSNLIQGSSATVWINDALSGGASLHNLTEKDNERLVPFLSKAPLDNNSFELRIESNLLVSNFCSAPKGTMWVDTERSEISLPYRLKRGVATINTTLLSHPTISVDGNEGALGIATTLIQEASRMLLNGDPLKSDIVINKRAKVQVTVDSDLFDQKVSEYPESIYPVYANGGVFITALEDGFEVLAQGTFSAENFIYYWPRVQSKIPDGASEVLVTQDGEVKQLKTITLHQGITPTVRESNIYLYVLFISALMIAALLGWLWWSRRAKSKA
ncbi:MAG: cellulose biosynthesis cyclic di-GMP-binding regulatory protein BcsB [Moraxellaceae bacterium]|nr:cellulose biosynthesis cyclic di-GMP-binding regulatory protein BcsB [Moraxellaceae bacterium]